MIKVSEGKKIRKERKNEQRWLNVEKIKIKKWMSEIWCTRLLFVTRLQCPECTSEHR